MMFLADQVFPLFFAFLLRSKSAVELCTPTTPGIYDITYTSRVYVYTNGANCARAYNTMPRIIKQVETLSEFKIKLKRHFQQ